MSTDRISKKAGWADLDKLPKGPNGRRLCRWCSKEVGKGRRTFCSDGCVDQHRIRSDPGYVRIKIFERDAGICSICMADTTVLKDKLREFWHKWPEIEAAKKAGIPDKFCGLELSKSWWEADHIIPVVEGGGEVGLEGYRTLCVPCHKDMTRALQKRLVAKRKELKDT